MPQSTHTITVVLDIPKKDKEILAFAKGVQSGLTNNPHFPSPSPVLAVFAADVAAYDAAETAASARAAGAVTIRNAKRTKVVQDLRHLRDYVQSVAETLTTDAITVVESAGLRVRKQGTRNKPELAVKDGATSGSVLVLAKAPASEASYYFQYSLDGKTWTSVPEGMKSSITVSGLTPSQTYFFRFRTLTRAGASDFSQVVSHMVK